MCMAMGMEWGFGNRDEPSTVSGWGARARRTYLNHMENLLIFGLLVIVAHLGNVHSDLTVMGAELFLAARIVYAALYIAGISALGIAHTGLFCRSGRHDHDRLCGADGGAQRRV